MKPQIIIIAIYLCSSQCILQSQSFNFWVDTDTNLDFEVTVNEFNRQDLLLSKTVKNGRDSFSIEFEAGGHRLRMLQFELYNETYGSISGGFPSLNTRLRISKGSNDEIRVEKLFEPAGQWYADSEEQMQASYLAYKSGDHAQTTSLVKALISDTTEARLDVISLFMFQLLYLDVVDESTTSEIERFYQIQKDKNIQWGESILTLIASKREKDASKQLPSLSAFDVNGSEKRIMELKQKPFMVLDFWATWCGPCINSFPLLLNLHEKYKDHLDIVAISIDKDAKTWKRHVSKHAFPWTSLIDNQAFEDKIEHRLGIVRIPTYILIDRNEQIVYKGSSLLEIDEIIENQK